MAYKAVNCPKCRTLTTCIGNEIDTEFSGTCPSCGWGVVCDAVLPRCLTHEELIDRGEKAKAARAQGVKNG